MRLILLFITLLLVQTGYAQTERKPGASRVVEVDRIAAVVNDDVITLFELTDRVRTVTRQLRQQKTPLPPPAVLEKQVLERMITDLIQLQFAKETSTKVDDIQLDRMLVRIAENNNLNTARFREALEHDGIVYAKFREDIRMEMVVSRIREREVENKIVVTDPEIDIYIKQQRARPSASEEFNLGHILVRVPEQASPEIIEKQKRRAEEVVKQLQAGADFGQISVSYSDAPDALQGGTLGWRSQDRLPTLFAEAVAKLKPAGITPILRSPNGFHVLKLLGRRGGSGAMVLQQTKVRHILIKTNELVSDSEAKRKLTELRDRLVNGGNFAELAKSHSNDLSSNKGGDLGWVYPGDTVPEFERAMDALKPGELSQPIKTAFGYHLMQVQDRKNEDVTQERERLQARQALRARKTDESYQEWLRQLRDRAYIEYRLEDR